MQNRFIDKSQTKDFAEYCKSIQLAETGHKKYRKAILDHGAIADDHMNKFLISAKAVVKSIKEMENSYSQDELDVRV